MGVYGLRFRVQDSGFRVYGFRRKRGAGGCLNNVHAFPDDG